MIYEVEVIARVYVSVEEGADDAAHRIVRDHVANGWLIGFEDGVARDAGHYIVKGLSAKVGEIRPFSGNKCVIKTEEEIF